MRKYLSLLILSVAFLLFQGQLFAQPGGVPELMYYKFDGSGTTVPNDASAPVGANPASILGSTHTQGGTGQFGGALVSTAGASTTDYLNTNWAPNLSGSWTISFWLSNVPQTTALNYVFGDVNATAFRCFTGGIAGAGDLLLRGPITDVLVTTAGASATGAVIHFVADASVPEIRAYVNGVLNNTVAQTSVAVSGTGPFKVGGYSGSAAMDGSLDEFRFYNRALDQTEITNTWNQMLPLSSGASNDAGVVGISPTSGTFCPGNQNIVASVQNFGTNQLDSVMVNWSLNSVLQTPVSYVGVIDTAGGAGANTVPVTLGNTNLMNGQSYTVDAWTSMPNGVADTVPGNDSATEVINVNIPGADNLAASNVTGTTADLSWNELGTATQWEIEWGTTGFTPGTGTIVFTTNNPYNLTGLTATTTYDFYVRSICGAGDTSASSAVFTFSTQCAAFTAPYAENFDAVTAPALPNCWFSTSPSPTQIQTVTMTDHGAAIPSPPNCLEINDIGGDNIFVSPAFSDLPTGNNQIRVKISYEGGASVFNDSLLIGVMSDPGNPSTFVPLDFVTLGIVGQPFQEFTFLLNNTALIGTNTHIGFRYRFNGGGFEYFLDDFFYEPIPSCPPPSSLTATNTSTTGADLNWVENGSATNWEVEYGLAGFTQGTGTVVNTSSNPYTASGLTASSNYEFYVRSICAPGDTSVWSSTPGAFATVCSQFTAPYFTDFDNVTAPNLPACWSVLEETPGADVFTVTSTDHGVPIPSGPNCLELNDGNPSIAVSPEFSDLPTGLNQVRMKIALELNGNGFSDTLIIGVMTNPTDVNTFVPLHKIFPPNLTTDVFTEITFPLDNTTLIGSATYVAISNVPATGGYEYFVDDFHYEVNPNIVPPVANFSFVNSSGLTVDFTDLSSNGPSNWIWNFGDGNVSIAQNPSHTYSTASSFNVTLTVSNGAGSDDTTITVVLGGFAGDLADQVKVYPNPTNNVFNIDLGIEKSTGYELMDLVGKSWMISEETMINKGSIDVSELPAGNYILKLNFGEDQVFKRLSIQR